MENAIPLLGIVRVIEAGLGLIVWRNALKVDTEETASINVNARMAPSVNRLRVNAFALLVITGDTATNLVNAVILAWTAPTSVCVPTAPNVIT